MPRSTLLGVKRAIALVPVLALVFATPPASAQALSIPFVKSKLANGLTVILHEDHTVPVAVVNVTFDVGSRFEAPKRTGFAHLFEHLMFQGSEHYDADYFIPLQAVGARINGTTNFDRTNYFEGVPAEELPLALWLESDRMGWLLPALTDEKLKNQQDVVRNERRQRYENRPYGMTWVWLFENLYPEGHPYNVPTIGKHEDLEAATLGDVQTFCKTWYVPNNATLVVVGDVTPDEVKALAQRYFGPIPKRDVPPAKNPLEMAEPGERLPPLHVQTNLPSVILGFNVPSLATAEDKRSVNALRLISALLDGGYSARISTQLERGEELVSGGSSSYDAYTRGDSLFTLTATPNLQKKKTVAQAEAGLWRLLDELKAKPPSAEELERIRAQVIAGVVYQRDSITSQATAIGSLETVGLSWKLMDTELAELQSVTAEDIQKAARTYFTRERLSVAHVLPEETAHE